MDREYEDYINGTQRTISLMDKEEARRQRFVTGPVLVLIQVQAKNFYIKTEFFVPTISKKKSTKMVLLFYTILTM